MFHSNTTIRELSLMPAFRKVQDLLFTHPDQKKLESSLKEYGIAKCGLTEALQDLSRQCRRDDFLLPLYPEEWNRARKGEGEPWKAKPLNFLKVKGITYSVIVCQIR